MLLWEAKTPILCYGIQKMEYTLKSNIRKAFQNENKNTQKFEGTYTQTTSTLKISFKLVMMFSDLEWSCIHFRLIIIKTM